MAKNNWQKKWSGIFKSKGEIRAGVVGLVAGLIPPTMNCTETLDKTYWLLDRLEREILKQKKKG